MKNVSKVFFSTMLLGMSMVLGVGEALSDGSVTTIKLHQSPPDLTTVDIGQAGRSPGDILAFEANLQGENGLTAVLNGYNLIMDTASRDQKVEDRFSHIVLDFRNGSTIIVAGRSTYQPNKLEIANSLPQPRAVIGGTGEYIGARGQVTTVRNEDGSYEHTVELVK